MMQSLQGQRILILEDEYFLADDLARALRDRGAEPVGPVSSVTEADALVTRERLDAAIVDLNLQGTMATEFVNRLAGTRLPCLIVSGYASEAVPNPSRMCHASKNRPALRPFSKPSQRNWLRTDRSAFQG